jgi:hypothetical protein
MAGKLGSCQCHVMLIHLRVVRFSHVCCHFPREYFFKKKHLEGMEVCRQILCVCIATSDPSKLIRYRDTCPIKQAIPGMKGDLKMTSAEDWR